ncbi:putative lysine N-acyltransferase C17G9.06c [Termitomyces sp. T112]|nr:putative lysine N-acyltransferase C17G9.06c [Termitomyces sp. T112]
MSTVSSVANRRLLSIHNHTTPLPEKIDGLVLILPRGDQVFASIATNASETLTQLRLNKTHILNYRINPNTYFSLELSAIGTRYEGVARHIPKANLFELSTPVEQGIPKDITITNTWAAIYALFTLYRTLEYIPIRFVYVPNTEELTRYLLISGLGRLTHNKKKVEGMENAIFLSRSAFWQGAGTTGYHTQGWLLAPTPTFPSLPSFTRSDMVIASHPLRPPKPHAGEVLYRRYCAAVGKSLEFVAFDIDGDPKRDGGLSQHMAAFHKWHNDERVNSAWGERGSLETHRDYIKGLLADPGVVPIMMRWNGELMGYVEIVWAKENHVAQYYPPDSPVGNWERGLHVLVGEDKFLGGSELWLRSLVHYIFLADPRTNRVVGEPKQTNSVILKAAQSAGFHNHATFDFPYKRSCLLFNPRERFFSNADRLY